MKSIEFYKTPYGKIMCQPVGEAAREVTESDREMIQEMLQLISERYPKAFEALSCLYSKSQRNRAYFEYQIVSRFIRCNFGEYDANSTDIDADGFFRFEEVGCPLRGECIHEGVICKPKSMVRLSRCEREIADLYLEGLTFRDIAAKLGKNAETVKVQLMRIKKKCGVKHCRDIIRVLRLKNY